MSKERMLRVLEYTGDASFIREQIERRGVKGSREVRPGCWIREAIIGDTSELLDIPPAGMPTASGPVLEVAGYCPHCDGPVYHRPGQPGEYDHTCTKENIG